MNIRLYILEPFLQPSLSVAFIKDRVGGVDQIVHVGFHEAVAQDFQVGVLLVFDVDDAPRVNTQIMKAFKT